MPGRRPAGPGLSRRALVRAGGASAAGALWACLTPAAAAAGVEAAVASLLAGREPFASGRLRLDLPEQFDQGTTVPLAVSVDGLMTAADHVRRIVVFAHGNPFPEVASVTFTPACGRADVATRIRLNEGRQEVVAVAELGQGGVAIARRTVEITVSGCSAETGVDLVEPMPRPQPRLKLPLTARRDELVEVKTMISHRMETGLRTDVHGRPIPRRIIHRLTCLEDGEPIFTADLSPAVAPNAYLRFSLVARRTATLGFVWREDGGGEYHARHALVVI